MIGMVVKTHNRFYHVKHEEHTYFCTMKGAFRQKDPAYRLPVIGDRVSLRLDSSASKGVDGYITDIESRDNALVRHMGDGRNNRIMAANLNHIFVVSAVVKPGVDWHLIDRYMLACELDRIPFSLVINKIELAPDFVEDPDLALYRDLGIPVLPTSVKKQAGLERLAAAADHGIALLTGTSGVGKSSLVNALAPGVSLATGEVDRKHGMGRHTTTNSILIPFGDGAFLADSPGLRDFSPPIVAPEEVRFGFREMLPFQAECKFGSCLHDREPGCAVRAAVEEGRIARRRFRSYRQLLEEMRQFHRDRY